MWLLHAPDRFIPETLTCLPSSPQRALLLLRDRLADLGIDLDCPLTSCLPSAWRIHVH